MQDQNDHPMDVSPDHVVDIDGTERWYLNNELHRDSDLPAVVQMDGAQKWYTHGVLTREITHDGTMRWYKDGELHREGDKPAVCGRKTGGEFQYFAYYKEGKLHREAYDETGLPLPAEHLLGTFKYYYKDGNLHSYLDVPTVEHKNTLKALTVKKDRYKDSELKHKEAIGEKDELIEASEEQKDELIKAKMVEESKLINIPPLGTPLTDYEKEFLDRPLNTFRPAVIESSGRTEYYKNGKRHREGIYFPAVISSDGSKYYYKNGKLDRGYDRPAVEYSDGRTEHYKNGNFYTPEHKDAYGLGQYKIQDLTEGIRKFWVGKTYGDPTLGMPWKMSYIEKSIREEEDFDYAARSREGKIEALRRANEKFPANPEADAHHKEYGKRLWRNGKQLYPYQSAPRTVSKWGDKGLREHKRNLRRIADEYETSLHNRL